MSSVRSLTARLSRLELALLPQPSPFERAYGSLEAFGASVQTGTNAGVLDSCDMALVVAAVRRWHRDGLWAS